MWVIFLLLLSLRLLIACPDGRCREMAFPSFYFFAGKRLVKNKIKTLRVPDMDACELRCYHEPNCVSFNFNTIANDEGKYPCQLNNSTHQEHDKDLKNAANYFYRAAENHCGNPTPCQHEGTCQSGYTDKGYHCLCPLGFTGDHCEHDIDECTQGSHDCLADHAQSINYDGSYRCGCKVGYEGDGKTSCKRKGCQTYTSLTEVDRKASYRTWYPALKKRDRGRVGWFRFQGDAGTKMATHCPVEYSCNTDSPGWLRGGHPKATDGIVTRRVCFHWGPCCRWSREIKVINCGDYYVYYLNGTPNGYFRFCTE